MKLDNYPEENALINLLMELMLQKRINSELNSRGRTNNRIVEYSFGSLIFEG